MATNFLHGGEFDFVVTPANDLAVEPVTFREGDPILIGRRIPAVAMSSRTDNTVENTVSFATGGKYDNVAVHITSDIEPGHRIYFDSTPPATADGNLVTAAGGGNVIWGHALAYELSTANVIIPVTLAAAR